ncbi:MAG: MFS transporter [Thermoplasmatota archaeon]
MQKRAAFIQFSASAATNAAAAFIAITAYRWGANLTQVGIIVAAYSASLFLSYLYSGRAADGHGRRRLVQAGLGLGAVVGLLQIFAHDPGSIAVVRALYGASVGLYPPALTALAYDANRKLGRFTAWGSFGSSLGTLAAGALTTTSFLGGYTTTVFLFASLMMAIGFFTSLFIPHKKEQTKPVPLFPRDVIRRNGPAYSALLLRHIGATAISSIFPLYLIHLGANLWVVALVSVLNGVAQFVTMQFVDKFASWHALVAGLVISGTCFALYAVFSTIVILAALQLLLGASWGLLYTGGLKFVMERNVERATSSGLLQSTLQLAAIVGPLAGGVVADRFGFRVLMLGGATLALLAIPIFLYELHRHPSFIEDLAPMRAHAVVRWTPTSEPEPPWAE